MGKGLVKIQRRSPFLSFPPETTILAQRFLTFTGTILSFAVPSVKQAEGLPGIDRFLNTGIHTPFQAPLLQ